MFVFFSFDVLYSFNFSELEEYGEECVGLGGGGRGGGIIRYKSIDFR